MNFGQQIWIDLFIGVFINDFGLPPWEDIILSFLALLLRRICFSSNFCFLAMICPVLSSFLNLLSIDDRRRWFEKLLFCFRKLIVEFAFFSWISRRLFSMSSFLIVSILFKLRLLLIFYSIFWHFVETGFRPLWTLSIFAIIIIFFFSIFSLLSTISLWDYPCA